MKNSFYQLQTIRKHPSNTSPSKIAYQFSKTQRFFSPSVNCPEAFYEIQTTLSRRRTSFGSGTRSDFTKNPQQTPAGASYYVKSSINGQNAKSFGCSRSNSPNQGHIPIQLASIPGPGQYQYDNSQSKKTGFSIRSRTLDVANKNISYKDNPGPGNYQTLDFQSKGGKNLVSKFKSVKNSSILTKQLRFPSIEIITPGPSTYRDLDPISGDSKYALSKHHGNGRRLFPQENRFGRGLFPVMQGPGPGAYDQLSIFGIYNNLKQTGQK